ncbi:MAG: VOC family protein [Spirochaetota bacterium]
MRADQPSIEGLRFTRLFFRAHNAERLREFYSEVLRVREGLLEFEDGAAPRNPLSAGLFHTAFLVPDRNSLAQAYLNLIRAGVRVGGASDHLVSEAIYFQDPEGNGVELYWDKPGDHWDEAIGQVRMGTYPLDVSGMLAELPGPGAPPEIEHVGHIHLRALSLKDSAQFWTSFGLSVTCKYAQIATFLAAGRYHHHIGVNRFSDWTKPLARAPGLAAMELELATSEASTRNIERYQTSPENIDLITSVATPPVNSR